MNDAHTSEPASRRLLTAALIGLATGVIVGVGFGVADHYVTGHSSYRLGGNVAGAVSASVTVTLLRLRRRSRGGCRPA